MVLQGASPSRGSEQSSNYLTSKCCYIIRSHRLLRIPSARIACLLRTHSLLDHEVLVSRQFENECSPNSNAQYHAGEHHKPNLHLKPEVRVAKKQSNLPGHDEILRLDFLCGWAVYLLGHSYGSALNLY